MTNTLKDLAEKLGQTLEIKHEAYGDAVGKSAAFLTLLYPNGIPVEAYGSVSLLLRIFDKQCRIANKPNAFGEDPFLDIGGYGLLGQRMVLNKAEAQIPTPESVSEILNTPRVKNCARCVEESKQELCWVCFYRYHLGDSVKTPSEFLKQFPLWSKTACEREVKDMAALGIKTEVKVESLGPTRLLRDGERLCEKCRIPTTSPGNDECWPCWFQRTPGAKPTPADQNPTWYRTGSPEEIQAMVDRGLV